MSSKAINWGKWASVAIVLTAIGAFMLWSFDQAAAYAPLPTKVQDHEQRIKTLETNDLANSIREADNFSAINDQLTWMRKHWPVDRAPRQEGNDGAETSERTNTMADKD